MLVPSTAMLAVGNVYEMLLECRGGQVERWLKPCVTGERVCSIAITEPQAGSDAAGIKTRAVRDGTGWRLTGHKHFISDGLVWDFFLVTAVTDPSKGANGISMLLVDKGLPGFTVGRDQPMMGLRAARAMSNSSSTTWSLSPRRSSAARETA